MTKADWTFGTGSVPEQGGKIKAAARAGLALAWFNVLVIVAAPLARMYLDIPSYTAFLIFFYALQFGLLLAVTGLVLVFVSVFHRLAAGWTRGAGIMILGILPVAGIVLVLGPGRIASPVIHDITTDVTNPPEFSAIRSLRSPTDNPLEYVGAEIARQQQAAYPDLGPIITGLRRDAALTRATSVAQDLGWRIVNVDYDSGIIEASDTTRIFGFIDDIVIRVQTYGDGSLVNIRSVSRLGLGDIGQNAARIRRYTEAYGH